MKIMIIGEASGVSPTLKEAFELLGHDCTILAFSNPQKRKGIRSFSSSRGKLSMIISHVHFLWVIYQQSKRADLTVSIGSPWLSNLFNIFPKVGGWYLRLIEKRCARIVYYALGCDPFFARSGSNCCAGCLQYPDEVTQKCRLLYQGKYREAVDVINKYYSSFFVAMPDYICSDIRNDMVSQLPLPFKIEDIPATKKHGKEKPLIVHAPSGRNRKGSKYILEAMNRVQNDFPESVECKVLENMPYHDFKQVLQAADIVVDQCLSKSYGMLAIEALSQGKVVLSGGEFFDSFEERSPIINITPNSDEIYQAIVSAIKLTEDDVAAEQRIRYCQSVHDYIGIARKIID